MTFLGLEPFGSTRSCGELGSRHGLVAQAAADAQNRQHPFQADLVGEGKNLSSAISAYRGSFIQVLAAKDLPDKLDTAHDGWNSAKSGAQGTADQLKGFDPSGYWKSVAAMNYQHNANKSGDAAQATAAAADTAASAVADCNQALQALLGVAAATAGAVDVDAATATASCNADPPSAAFVKLSEMAKAVLAEKDRLDQGVDAFRAGVVQDIAKLNTIQEGLDKGSGGKWPALERAVVD